MRDEPRATWDFYLTNPGGCWTSSKTKWEVRGVVGGWERERVMNPIWVVLEIQGRRFFKHSPVPLAFRIKNNNNNCFCYGMQQSLHRYLHLYVPCSWEKLPGSNPSWPWEDYQYLPKPDYSSAHCKLILPSSQGIEVSQKYCESVFCTEPGPWKMLSKRQQRFQRKALRITFSPNDVKNIGVFRKVLCVFKLYKTYLIIWFKKPYT